VAHNWRARVVLQPFFSESWLCEPAHYRRASRAGASGAQPKELAPRSGETSPEVRRWQRTSIGRAAPISAQAQCADRRSPGCSRSLAQPQPASTQCAADFLPLSLRYSIGASFSRSTKSDMDHYQSVMEEPAGRPIPQGIEDPGHLCNRRGISNPRQQLAGSVPAIGELWVRG
jgi:hypothetical protein